MASLSAEGGSAEDVRTVWRYFVEAASGDLMGGDVLYAYLAADLYLQHLTKEMPPRVLIDFRGGGKPVLLSRLADGQAIADVENAVE